MSIRSFSLRNSRRLFSYSTAHLRVMELETRDVMSVTLASISNQDMFIDRPLFLPVTVTNTPTGPVTTTVASGNSNLEATVLSGGQSLVLTVSGTDKNGNTFSGDITIRFFENVAPETIANIKTLVNAGYYNNKLFHRIIDTFMIQGGSPTGTGVGGSSLVSDVQDERNADYTFASPGILAMANAGRDNNNAQFFITDPKDLLTARPNFLNFNYTIAGIMTNGFDIYQKIITTPVHANSVNEVSAPNSPVTITNAKLITDPNNAVIELKPKAGFTGTANITVSAQDNVGAPTQQSFTLTGVAYPTTVSDVPFLGPVSNATTTQNTPVTITLTSVVPQNKTANYSLVATTNAANVTINLNQTTGVATVTPLGTFTGVVNLTAGVFDPNNTNSTGNPDTQKFTLTVNAGTVTSTTTVTLSSATTVVGKPIAIFAAIGNVGTSKGTIEFFADSTSIGKVNAYDNRGTIDYTPSVAGSQNITAKFVSTDSTVSGSTSANVALATSTGTAPRTLTNVTAPSSGSASVVTADVSVGNKINVDVFPGFTGGVRLAVGDVTGDGQTDIVCVAGQGGSSIVRVIDGSNGQILTALDRMMFEETFRGGLTVSVGDFGGKGYDQVVVGAGRTGGPRVTAWDFKTNSQLYNYFAYDSTLRGGVTVSAADLRGNGYFLIVTGAGQGAGPVVAVWDGVKTPTGANGQTPVQYGSSVFAGDSSNRDGIQVGSGTPRTDLTRLITFGPQSPDNSPLSNSLDPFTTGIFVG